MENNIMRSFSFKAESARANEWNVHTGFSCAWGKTDQTARLAAVQSSGATRQEHQLWKDRSRLVGTVTTWMGDLYAGHFTPTPRLSPDFPQTRFPDKVPRQGSQGPSRCLQVLTNSICQVRLCKSLHLHHSPYKSS